MTRALKEEVNGRDLVIQMIQGLGALDLLPGTKDFEAHREQREESMNLLRLKLLKDLDAEGSEPLTVLVTGGTNVGKSTVFNGLVGAELACPTPLARGTKIPLLAGHPDQRQLVLGDRLLSGYGRGPLGESEELNRELEGESPLTFRYALDSEEVPRDLLFLDSTDVDSDRELNLRIAGDLLLVCDVAVFVVSPTKYRDEAVIRSMRRAAALGRRIHVVWNPYEEQHAEALAHFRQSVLEDELGGLLEHPAPVHRLPPVPGGDHARVAEELRELREELVETASHRAALRAESMRNAMAEIETRVGAILARVQDEQQILGGIHRSLETGKTLALEGYRRSVQGLSADQVHQAFKVMWQKTRVPLIDPTMDSAFALFRKIIWLLGFKLPTAGEKRDDPLGGRDRVALRTLLQQLVDQVDRQLSAVRDPRYEQLTRELRQTLAAGELERDLNSLAIIGTRSRREWLDARVADMLETLKENPGRYYFVTAVRTLFSVVPTVSVLLFVWHGVAAIIIVIPTVHALMTQVAKTIFFRGYLIRHRPRLERIWIESIDGELEAGFVREASEAVPRGVDPKLLERVRSGLGRLRDRVRAQLEARALESAEEERPAGDGAARPSETSS